MSAEATGDYLGMPLRRFLDVVAAAEPAPGGGVVAAVAVGLAAGLAAMAAGLSTEHLRDAGAVVAAAEKLRAEVAPLAEADAAAYADVLAAMAQPRGAPGRREAIDSALSRAADVPLQIAEAGAGVLALASRLERDGNPNLRGDAATARLLAAAAVRSATTLVRLNLFDADDPRVGRARVLDALAQI